MNTQILIYIPPRKDWSWNRAYYHIVIDFLGCLYNLNNYTLTHSTLLFDKAWLLPHKKMFAKQWADIIAPDIHSIIYRSVAPFYKNHSNFIEIASKTSILDEGTPTEKKENVIKFLQNKVSQILSSNIKQDKLLLIKRNLTRVSPNFDALLSLCSEYCIKHNLELDIFDDSQDLGSVVSQLSRFASAKIVIGQHGAGFLNLLACQKNTIFIECKGIFRKKNNGTILNKEDPVVFENLAKILNIKHKKSLNDRANNINIEDCARYLDLVH